MTLQTDLPARPAAAGGGTAGRGAGPDLRPGRARGGTAAAGALRLAPRTGLCPPGRARGDRRRLPRHRRADRLRGRGPGGRARLRRDARAALAWTTSPAGFLGQVRQARCRRPAAHGLGTTVRRASDGAVHTDSKAKVVTVLLYLDETWTQPGGRLRSPLRGRPRLTTRPRSSRRAARCSRSAAPRNSCTASRHARASDGRCRCSTPGRSGPSAGRSTRPALRKRLKRLLRRSG